MTEFKIKLADKVIGVKAINPSTQTFCRKYTVSDNETCDLLVELCPDDIQREREKSYAEDDFEGKERRQFSDEYLETLALYRKIADGICELDVLLFHGSVISVDGEGYLFTAKSGTGKSTHTRLWRQLLGDRAVMVNDDKPLISVSNDGKVTVYGTPWCGKHGLGDNINANLRAICIIERAPENSIVRVDPISVYPLLLQQTYRSSHPSKLMVTLPLLDRMLKSVAVFKLGCNMEKEAAEVSYTAMSGKEI